MPEPHGVNMGQGNLASRRWDAEYGGGRYANEEPVNFVKTIMSALEVSGRSLRGLYVGCGNGRNYVPLAGSGLNILGIDISAAAIGDLSRRHPSLSGKLLCKSLADFEPRGLFDYVVAIQVFQHGAESDVSRHFDSVSCLLKAGGLLFLRVNSASIEICLRHTVVEKNMHGGFTVRYEEGPKKGLDIHFFSQAELEAHLLRRNFELVSGPSEDSVLRAPPKTGTWSQWEAVSRKN